MAHYCFFHEKELEKFFLTSTKQLVLIISSIFTRCCIPVDFQSPSNKPIFIIQAADSCPISKVRHTLCRRSAFGLGPVWDTTFSSTEIRTIFRLSDCLFVINNRKSTFRASIIESTATAVRLWLGLGVRLGLELN